MKRTIILSFTGLLLLSCNNPFVSDTSKPATNQTETTESNNKSAAAEEEESSDNDSSLVLNNGQKWPVNAEMKPFVEKGKSILDQYLRTGGVNYTQLAADLKSQDDRLIKSCTMSGEAHEELHKWLHPHLTLVDSLKNCRTKEDAKEIINRLVVSYQTYSEYFN